jgi:hypothetical protein
MRDCPLKRERDYSTLNSTCGEYRITMEESFILETLRALRGRYRKKILAERLIRALFWASCTSMAILVVIKSLGGGAPFVYYAFIPFFVALLAPLMLYFIQKLPLMKIALMVDDRLQMKERLSTVLEWIEGQKKRTLMYKGLLKDASANARLIRPERAFPFEIPRKFRLLALTLPLTLVLVLTPPWGIVKIFPTPEEAQNIRVAARKLDNLAEQLERKSLKDPKASLELKRKAQEIKELSRELKKSTTGKKEALVKISSLRDRFREDQKRIAAQKSLLERMNKALEEQGRSRSGSTEVSLAEKLREMAKKLTKSDLAEEERKKIAGDLKKMENAAKSDSDIKKELQDALSAMDRNDGEGAAEKLKSLAEKMEAQSLADRETRDMMKEIGESKNKLAGNDETAEADGDGEEEPGTGKEQGGESPGAGEGQGNSEGTGGESAKETTGMSKNFKGAKKGGEAPPDFGVGSTNKEEKSGGKEAPRHYAERQSSKESHWKEFYHKLYETERVKMESGSTKVKGQRTGSQGTILSQEIKGGVPAVKRQADEPRQLYTTYKGRAEESVNRERVPKEYKTLVKDYFKEIDPGK